MKQSPILEKFDNVEVQIPFSGFYNSLHDSQLESAFGYEIDYQTNEKNVPDEMLRDACSWVDWETMRGDYIRKYAQNWLSEFYGKTDLTLTPINNVEMQSPREYNFTTDRLFMKFPLVELLKVYDYVNGGGESLEGFKALVEEKFKSRSGFVSFYEWRLEEWGNPHEIEWDLNQWGALLEYLCPDDGELYVEEVSLEWTKEGIEEINKIDKWVELHEEELAKVKTFTKGWVTL